MWASSIVVLPATIAGFIDNSTLQKIAIALSPGRLVCSIAIAITIFFLYYLFTALFYKPEKMIAFLKNKNAYISLPSGEEPAKYIDRSLEGMAFVGAIYLCFFVLVSEIVSHTDGVVIISFFTGGIALIEVVVIMLDLFVESNIRRQTGSLVKVAEFHDVPKAGFCKSLLEGQGIQCHLRGYYYRALLYFFGPYIEVSVLVPEDKAVEAAELVKRYIE